jgi:hypothetical protein
MIFLREALLYVIQDGYFWPAMAFTTMVGLFIGSLLYDGEFKEAKKMLVSLISYGILISITISTRIIPNLSEVEPAHYYMPFAGIITITLVTAFYLIGIVIGVNIIGIVHKGGEHK